MITPRQAVALDALRQGGTLNDVRDRLAVSHSVARTKLARLVDKGLVERTASHYAGAKGNAHLYNLTPASRAAWAGSIK